jgi:hypothetical protein
MGVFHVSQTLVRIFRSIYLCINIPGSPLHTATAFKMLTALNVREVPASRDPTQKAKSTAKMDTHAGNLLMELHSQMGILVIAKTCGVTLDDLRGKTRLPRETFDKVVTEVTRIFMGKS